ncbi:hypothetical protein Kpol_505p8 [Vanderwaltozyma polyspora DSM 70294]|uniref:RGS domain-containing protein n=1 Tax=Vanderwaltozyma polyspora (strain ATCC 22028 / DSM 70294 / BCRC 21397 / CBS 2163 / NBRC 10782 / NRRL Y-8283 / UCD 57-17) TaxID=436907 RepID=A7TN99_VANPO|nr:uncharacterized protein Kpol_505p8 [Vanderwaltozyma polyspora DSM 70294]EDO16231.1 hypothetical protein Kpol_505p8 [Vanderwaltozyma polyspora DSM 70294]
MSVKNMPSLNQVLSEFGISESYDTSERSRIEYKGVDKFVIDSFQKFLIMKHCQENLAFLIVTNGFLKGLEKKSNAIIVNNWNSEVYFNFIKEDSKYELYLPWALKESFEKSFALHELPSIQSVRQARRHAINALQEAYRQFLQMTHNTNKKRGSNIKE